MLSAALAALVTTACVLTVAWLWFGLSWRCGRCRRRYHRARSCNPCKERVRW